jgi:hypothetical protein
MANPFTRGSAWDRARPDYSRTGDFKRGHEKLGGRKPGTKNLFSTEYKMALLEAAYRVGYHGNGKDGVRGYFTWVSERDPGFFYAEFGDLIAKMIDGGIRGGQSVSPHHSAQAPRRSPALVRLGGEVARAWRLRIARGNNRPPPAAVANMSFHRCSALACSSDKTGTLASLQAPSALRA